MRFVVEADGGSRGNPGPAGYGAVVKDIDGRVLVEAAEAIGTATNNVAEYRGLIAGLESLLTVGGEGVSAEVRMDSKLVIEQMAGRWKIKNEGLRPLALEAGALARRLQVTWKWIPREQNSHADRLANEAMDAAAKGLKWESTGVADFVSAPASGTAPAAGPAAPAREHAPISDLAPGPTAPALVPEPAASLAAPAPAAPSTAVRRERGEGTGWMARPTRVATSFLLLRHGETPLSVEKRFSGTGDPSLTPRGLAQAEAAALRLSREPYAIDVIVTSPLARARQTAEAVASRTGVPVRIEQDLREADFGAWEGHTFAEIQRSWAAELAAWLSDPSAAPPGGESFAAAGRRVELARDRIIAEHEGKTVLVVSHVTPIKLLLRFALMAPPEALYRMHLDVACLSVIDYYADGPAVVRALNDTSHLG
ncbi:bifunctional RNase H/acid phosphatase [Microtetraspora sp. NBRC 16547]|uniref:bifunctional RNase H/acid phosphatase n=1 Tax=Microtetraspora sp. NBRC 16547 TaxID=3030993 RepID=UPI0024A3C8D9|nr:bifunctional RNase H/acid phosphatase [Microtetraspora sp. NBRC 16547]GLW96537.1 bifunctional RNase H/acid phosphatase [Microtetraspora sp. NBRC 16547]